MSLNMALLSREVSTRRTFMEAGGGAHQSTIGPARNGCFGTRDLRRNAEGKVTQQKMAPRIRRVMGTPSLSSRTPLRIEKRAPPMPPPANVIPVLQVAMSQRLTSGREFMEPTRTHARLRLLRKYDEGRVAAAKNMQAWPRPYSRPSVRNRSGRLCVHQLPSIGPNVTQALPKSATGPRPKRSGRISAGAPS